MVLEFSVRPIRGAQHQLVAEDVESEGFVFHLLLWTWGFGGGNLYAECCALLWHDFESPTSGDDFENKLAVADNDALDTNAAGASASDHLGQCAVQLGAGQLGGGRGTTGKDVVAKNFARVSEPKRIEGLRNLVLVTVSGDVVEAELSSLAGR